MLICVDSWLTKVNYKQKMVIPTDKEAKNINQYLDLPGHAEHEKPKIKTNCVNLVWEIILNHEKNKS